jgi:serine-type D-Ala-D-Ala carboxypeptidase/endopeptidase (penicillin-binding protein 4)
MADPFISGCLASQSHLARRYLAALGMFLLAVRSARLTLAGLVAIATIALAPPPAGAIAPDSPGRTPVARSAAATATTSLTRGQLCSGLRQRLRRGGSRTGLFVLNASTGEVTCRASARTRRLLASNTKLYTTAAALGRFGPDDRIPTTLWASGAIRSGVLNGSLYLVGGGDPALASPAFSGRFRGGLGTNLFALTRSVTAAGITRVKGRLFADDTVFDRLRGVADSGFAASPYIGPLSGLQFNSGFADSNASHFASDPARVAATKLVRSLRKRGIGVSSRIGVRDLPGGSTRIGFVRSPRMSRLVDWTNVNSDNLFAETLLKRLGAQFGGRGSTRAGAAVAERFARGHDSAVEQVDGSGLTAAGGASPTQVGRLLAAMRATPVDAEFVESLAVAGREGTLADRMRGTAAAGRCRAKTGTLTGVSALSGYCFNRSGKVMVFSILMNGVGDLSRAHLMQDQMAALIARY